MDNLTWQRQKSSRSTKYQRAKGLLNDTNGIKANNTVYSFNLYCEKCCNYLKQPEDVTIY